MRETLYAACVTNVSAALLTRVGSQSLDSERSAGSGGGQRAPKKAREEVSYYVPNTADQLKAARASIAQFSFDRCVCLARTCVVARSPVPRMHVVTHPAECCPGPSVRGSVCVRSKQPLKKAMPSVLWTLLL